MNFQLGIQKCLHLHIEESKKKPNINHEYGMFEKVDGWFTYVDYIDGNCTAPFSRQQRKIPSLVNYQHRFKKLNIPSKARVIAEAYIPGIPFYEANGILNRSKGDCHAAGVEFVIHDIIHIDEPKTPFKYRYDYLKNLDLSEGLKLAPLLGVSSDKEIWMETFYPIIRDGGEGLILKQMDAVYQPDKRNSSLMKVKLEETFDLLCKDFFTTIGEKGNLAYNLLLVDKAGTEVVVVVASHEQIANFKMYSPIGKVIQVKTMCRTKDGVYRESRFDCTRYDKDINDID